MSTEKQRKSVSFSDGAMVVESNGATSQSTTLDPEKSTAENHSTDPAVDEVTDMFKDLAKKKKKKSKKDAEDGDAEKPEANDDEIDMSALKKKKKKKPKADDFDAKLAEVGEEGDENKATGSEDPKQSGDMNLGTGIWEHNQTSPIQYDLLLKRFFTNLHDRHPDLTGGIAKNYKIPPPQCLREGNKKTIFANLAEISKRLRRNDEHVTQFLFAELGTTGSVDASRRLVIRGRFQSKQIENILRRYIADYVSCKTCRALTTDLARGENRLWYITCQSCGSRRAVPAIKVGFKAQVGKRKRAQG